MEPFMTRFRPFSTVALLMFFVSAALVSTSLPAWAQAWNAPVRGSWVRPGTPKAGDVVLASGGKGCVIVVSPK